MHHYSHNSDVEEFIIALKDVEARVLSYALSREKEKESQFAIFFYLTEGSKCLKEINISVRSASSMDIVTLIQHSERIFMALSLENGASKDFFSLSSNDADNEPAISGSAELLNGILVKLENELRSYRFEKDIDMWLTCLKFFRRMACHLAADSSLNPFFVNVSNFLTSQIATSKYQSPQVISAFGYVMVDLILKNTGCSREAQSSSIDVEKFHSLIFKLLMYPKLEVRLNMALCFRKLFLLCPEKRELLKQRLDSRESDINCLSHKVLLIESCAGVEFRDYNRLYDLLSQSRNTVQSVSISLLLAKQQPNLKNAILFWMAKIMDERKPSFSKCLDILNKVKLESFGISVQECLEFCRPALIPTWFLSKDAESLATFSSVLSLRSVDVIIRTLPHILAKSFEISKQGLANFQSTLKRFDSGRYGDLRDLKNAASSQAQDIIFLLISEDSRNSDRNKILERCCAAPHAPPRELSIHDGKDAVAIDIVQRVITLNTASGGASLNVYLSAMMEDRHPIALKMQLERRDIRLYKHAYSDILRILQTTTDDLIEHSIMRVLLDEGSDVIASAADISILFSYLSKKLSITTKSAIVGKSAVDALQMLIKLQHLRKNHTQRREDIRDEESLYVMDRLVELTSDHHLETYLLSQELIQRNFEYILANAGRRFSPAALEQIESFSASSFQEDALVDRMLDISKEATWDSAEVETNLWIFQIMSKVTQTFITTPFFKTLLPLFRISPDFCLAAAPYVIEVALKEGGSPAESMITAGLQHFFTRHIHQKKESIQCVLSILDHLLKKDFSIRRDDSISISHLNLNLFNISYACLHVGAFRRALLWVELAKPNMEESFDLLCQIYRKLDADDYSGILSRGGSSYYTSLNRFKQSEKWVNVLNIAESFTSTNLNDDGINFELESARALAQLGFNKLLTERLKSISTLRYRNRDLDDLYFESLWRCGSWEVDVKDLESEGANGYIYHSLQSLIFYGLGDKAEHYAKKGIQSVLQNFKDYELDICNQNLEFLVLPTTFQEILEAVEVHRCLKNHDNDTMRRVFTLWESRGVALLKETGFSNCERVFSCRRLLFDWLLSSSSTPSPVIVNHFVQFLTTYSKQARGSGYFHLAHTSLLKLRALLTDPTMAEVEELKLLWAQGNKMAAIDALRGKIKMLKKSEEQNPMIGKLYLLCAKWADNLRSTTPVEILGMYDSSLEYESRTSSGDLKSRGKTRFKFAEFADRYYQSLIMDESYLLLRKLTKEFEDAQKKRGNMLDENEMRKNKKALLRLKLDKDELLGYETALHECLTKQSDNWNLSIFRVCTLWFTNPDETSISHLLKTEFPLVPTHKFLVLMYQLTARMTTEKTEFQTILKSLVYKIAMEYPSSSMYQLLALRNSRSSTNLPVAAKMLLGELKAGGLALFDDFEALTIAYSHLAEYTAKVTGSRQKVDMRGSMKLSTVDFSRLNVLTANNSIEEDKNAQEGPRIKGFRDFYYLVGDDLRQDAVLSKVFSILNVLLKTSKTSEQRNLRLRTYKVIPLADRVGVIEWLENTMPLGECIAQAHSKSFPDEISLVEGRKRVMKEHEASSNPQSKLKIFETVERLISPVLHLFFVDTFQDPHRWYENRKSFTRTTATSCMIGWVVGLGDRHPQNILIDKRTGELIHIDFGIAFDSGRLLSIPEQVPFRLTRNIVDGLGVLKTDGAFKLCSVETLNVIRKSSDVLFAILEVLRFDPLYQWRSSSKGRISDTSSQSNDAERALLGVKRKVTSNLGMDCQVNELIATATDKSLLSKMYSGW
ncbi:hypothetical protein HDU67_009025 [Dinochytrium kinnereticum]|nr:hypothetical protein HDU67_009025 [Dinochytrium kinnereticum]